MNENPSPNVSAFIFDWSIFRIFISFSFVVIVNQETEFGAIHKNSSK